MKFYHLRNDSSLLYFLDRQDDILPKRFTTMRQTHPREKKVIVLSKLCSFRGTLPAASLFSSRHTLRERSRIHNRMSVFSRGCLLPHVGKSVSQMWFSGSEPCVVGVATLFCEIWMSEKLRQSEIRNVINDKSQGSIAKHLSYDGLF